MKINVLVGITLRIIILFAIGIIGTYIPEHLKWFFKDVYKGESVEWSARHCFFQTMMVLLFILSCVNFIIGCRKIIIKNYDITKW